MLTSKLLKQSHNFMKFRPIMNMNSVPRMVNFMGLAFQNKNFSISVNAAVTQMESSFA